MEKQFVSYEIASKLKELGFNEPCFGIFDVNNSVYCYAKCEYFESQEKAQYMFGNDKIKVTLAPIYQQIVDWFRTKHNLFIELVIDQTAEPKFTYIITRYLGDFNWEEPIMPEFLYRTYEESREEAILKALNYVRQNKLRGDIR